MLLAIATSREPGVASRPTVQIKLQKRSENLSFHATWESELKSSVHADVFVDDVAASRRAIELVKLSKHGSMSVLTTGAEHLN
ncbi:MAG: hypothetical protein J0I47_09250 [Sphingomonas sp.]|uniref:hypothetical protein n=1 Tax=Sphingomonas sp. TaxID=28214 RepID=UPI001ACDF258|nr:hypothetical protein [Sphingomonas sp.]MBN8808405.1 hypothetical protein [Sphingomonas sp.]